VRKPSGNLGFGSSRKREGVAEKHFPREWRPPSHLDANFASNKTPCTQRPLKKGGQQTQSPGKVIGELNNTLVV